MSSTPLFTPYGVVDQLDLYPGFYWNFVRYADPYNLYPQQTPWECATPLAESYAPKMTVQMPSVFDPHNIS